MKNPTILFYAIFLSILTLGCEKQKDDLNTKNTKGFSLIINDSLTFNSNLIDFYDFSSHLVYLKTGNNFSYSGLGSFSVQVDSEDIYTGKMVSMYSSHLPMGPVITCVPAFYKEYIIPIGYHQLTDTEDNSIADPRNDSRIIQALKKYKQYKEGLSSEILSIQKLSDNKIQATIELTNLDSDDLLFLDPDRMGLELFHYFTRGLIINDSHNNSYTHKLTIEEPNSLNSWETDWLSVIKSKETKIISIIYDDFEALPSGEFSAFFNFPGLNSQIEREDLQQHNGRIWLGQLNNSKPIIIE